MSLNYNKFKDLFSGDLWTKYRKMPKNMKVEETWKAEAFFETEEIYYM